MAVRRLADRRDEPASRGLQRHSVDAKRHGPAHRPAGGSRVREGRIRGPPLCHGPARPPGQSACASERSRRIEERQAAQSAQGRSATLARDVRGKATRLGNRRRGLATSDARRAAQLRADMAGEGPSGGTAENSLRLRQGESQGDEDPETALAVWVKLAQALVKSPDAKDRQLAGAIARYVQQTPAAIEHMRKRQSEKQRELPGCDRPSRADPSGSNGPEIERVPPVRRSERHEAQSSGAIRLVSVARLGLLSCLCRVAVQALRCILGPSAILKEIAMTAVLQMGVLPVASRRPSSPASSGCSGRRVAGLRSSWPTFRASVPEPYSGSKPASSPDLDTRRALAKAFGAEDIGNVFSKPCVIPTNRGDEGRA